MIDIKKLWEAMPRDVQRKISCHDLKRTVDAYNQPKTMTLEEFIEKLYAAGWTAPCDAQHKNIVAIWEELKQKGITIPL